MDFGSLLPAIAVILAIVSVLVYRYYTRDGISPNLSAVFNAVKTIVEKLDDLDLENEEKKTFAVDYVFLVVSRLGYKVDKQMIDDMIEDAVFVLHESRKFLESLEPKEINHGQ